jgi:hypothetical protein
MVYISEAEVQQWLEPSKLQVLVVDPELEASARDIVFTTVSRAYGVTTWLDSASTPSLIRKVMSMLVASWMYHRAFANDSDRELAWAVKLESMAMLAMTGIVSGAFDLPEVEGLVGSSLGPTFWPDSSTLPKFTMEDIF